MKKRLSLLLVLAVLFSLFIIPASADSTETLNVTGAGRSDTYTLTRAELEEMPKIIATYSTVDNFPTAKTVMYSGVSLKTLLDRAGVSPEATLIRVSSADGYSRTFTINELLNTKRYYFPNVAEGKVDISYEVKPIIALKSGSGTDSLSDCGLTLVMGQRDVTEQTNPYFCKNVVKIEVLKDKIETWEQVSASPASGGVPKSGGVVLTDADNQAKIYYTLDGSVPTVHSAMYNISADNFQPGLNLEVPVEDGSVIRAVAVGPGKADSEVATFTYKKGLAEMIVFTDLKGFEWAEDAIHSLVGAGIVNGMGGSSYEPGSSLTRAQLVKMMVLAVDGIAPDKAAKSRFPDVPASQWYADFVERAAELKLIEGYTDGSFAPEKQVSKEEMLTIVIRALGYDSEAKAMNGKGLFEYAATENISNWALGYAEMAEELLLVEHGHFAKILDKGYSLEGASHANRAEAAETVGRALVILTEMDASGSGS